MPQAIIRVSRELLERVLMLPPGTTILAVSDQAYFDSGDIALRVECPAARPTPEGCRLPEVRPVYREAGGKAEFVRWDGDLRPPPGTRAELIARMVDESAPSGGSAIASRVVEQDLQRSLSPEFLKALGIEPQADAGSSPAWSGHTDEPHVVRGG